MRKIFVLLMSIFICLNIMPVKAMEKAADTLKKKVVTEGAGLYADPMEEGRYIYRGQGNFGPGNYIILGDDENDLANEYKIVSVEKDGTIKVRKSQKIGALPLDEKGARQSINSEDVCTSGWGCKAWGSNTTTLDSNGNKVTQMPWAVGGTLKNLPEKEATLNTYLNNDWSNTLDKKIQNLIVEKLWNVGPTDWNQTNLSDSIKEESAYKWKGKIALINVTDYIKGSTNESVWNGYNSNYLFVNGDQWFLTPFADSTASQSIGDFGKEYAGFKAGIYPAFYLSSEIAIKGDGSSGNPYKIVYDKEEIKGSQVDNNKKVDVVEVPSTSATMSIIIASMGIIFMACSIVLTKKMTNR